MTLNATYADDLSRVRLTFSGANTDADYAIIERTTDGVNWSVVRGGATVPVTAGAGQLDDYEFVAGVQNTYRITYKDSAPITWIGSSGPFTGVNTSLVVAYNGGTQVGDLVLCIATIRNTSASVVVPAGWTVFASVSNVKVFGKIYDGSPPPTINFTGGVAGADVTAQTTTFRNADIDSLGGNTSFGSSAQNITVSGMTPSEVPAQYVVFGWKQDDWSSVSTSPVFAAELGNVVSTAGDDAGHLWFTRAVTTKTLQPTTTFTLTGGTTAPVVSGKFMLGRRKNVGVETQTITPALDSIWLKNPSRPSLNTKICVTDVSDITRPSRVGVFEVIGRTMPVAVTDVQGSRRLTLTITTTDLGAAADMDARLSSGEPVFIQTPSTDHAVPTMYAVLGDVVQSKRTFNGERRFFTLPLVEVAAPGSIVTGDTILWLDVPATYGTWADVIAAKTSWSNLMDSIATGSVIVP
ncbi:hypothetical protein ACIA2T_19665 [Amycolatopsis japonica]|uniref:hypothetical protein n=1 Tax=Amycolatopsis japonica TaxID=208439 RepID=UPI0037A39D8C